MAPKQKTFELIPDPVGQPGQGIQAGSVLSKPPMTTKQAKKLYRQKNQGPKLSKAEQRRIELMEQDRIRKEFEREKAQARARTARERKKEKEEKEKEERRRKGLPLIDIHPSQDTISNFISRMGFGRKPVSNGGKSKLDTVQEAESVTVTEGEPGTETDGGNTHEEDEASEKENQQPSDNAGDRPAKRRRTTHPNGKPDRKLDGKLLDRMIHIPSQRSLGAVARVAQELGMESRSRASSVDTDDAATETMLEDQLIADVEMASSRSMAISSPIKPTPVKEASPPYVPATESVSTVPTIPQQTRPASRIPPSIQPEPQPPKASISDNLTTTKTAASTHVRTRHGEGTFKKPTSPFVSHLREKVDIESPAIRDPSAPPRFKAPAETQNSNLAKPRFLPQHVQAPRPIPVQASPTYAGSRRTVTGVVNAIPTSTQLFVLNHADELFPSASQEAQELLEDQIPAAKARPIAGSSLVRKSPKPTPKAMAAHRPVTTSHPRPPFLSRQQMKPPPLKATAPLEFSFLSTQDFILSSQDMLELETPSKVDEDPTPNKPPETRPFAKTAASPTKRQEGPESGRPRVTELHVPTEPKAPALSSTTCSQPEGGLGCRRSSSAASGGRTGIQAEICMGQAKDAVDCPTRLHSPQRRHPSGPEDCRQPSQPPSQPASRTTFAQRESRSREDPSDQSHSSKQVIGNAPSICRSLSSAKLPRTNSPSDAKDAIATPRASPPKKRMFGSSGPGAEVLVAMERSYRENLQERRRREDELRALENKQQEAERLARELADIIDADDELSDGGVRGDTKLHQSTNTGVSATNELRQTSSGKPSGKTELPASQETDYGDFDFDAGEEELGILADMAWVDDDLDGF